jgi:hypothetical protein
MLASEIIKELQKIIDKHGDCDLRFFGEALGCQEYLDPCSISDKEAGDNIYIELEM